MSKHIPILYKMIILFSVFCCLNRSDYNLPLAVLSVLIWDIEGQQARVVYLTLFTFLLDIGWLVLHGYLWFVADYTLDKQTDHSRLMNIFVYSMSVPMTVLKFAIVILAFLNDHKIGALTCRAMKKNFLEAIRGGKLKTAANYSPTEGGDEQKNDVPVF